MRGRNMQILKTPFEFRIHTENPLKTEMHIFAFANVFWN